MTKLLLLGATAFLLSGCLYTSHHFNSGRVLDPGQTAVTLGYGTYRLYDATCSDKQNYESFMDSTGTPLCANRSNDEDTVPGKVKVVEIPKFSLGYRLGVRREWGPFTGVELGWHLEAPTNPVSAEFDLKFGLPAPSRWRAHHSLSGGWIIGAWADNSFFGEYAASRTFGALTGPDAHALYASYRLTYLATQPEEAIRTERFAIGFKHKNRIAHQATLGVYLRLPDIVLLPDFLSPHATASTPWVRNLNSARPDQKILLDMNLGFGWRF